MSTNSSSVSFACPYPSKRDVIVKDAATWLEGKKIDDDVGELWRIHDKIYDLTEFASRHPGGKFWIESTKGTDVTEAFESSHLNPSVEKLLPKYFVKDATSRRNSPYTFREDGFYRTLKRKVWPIIAKEGTGPSLKMIVMQDSMVLVFILTMLTAAYLRSFALVTLAGLFLGMVMGMAHNFFHQADNFRMYYFDLSTLSSKDWRITHAISHHLFTNTLYDFEISVAEPFAHFLPNPRKNLFVRLAMPILFHGMLFFAFQIEAIKKIYTFTVGRRKPSPENFLPFIQMAVMMYLSGSLGIGFKLWFLMTSASCFWFAYLSLIGSHHHPEALHAFDTPREDTDWGLLQLDCVRDRIETTGSLFLVSTTFGDHALHHLFPTVDHSKLPLLYPKFLETCRDFDNPYTFYTQSNLLKGMYQQLVSNTPNSDPPGLRKPSRVILPPQYKQFGEKEL